MTPDIDRLCKDYVRAITQDRQGDAPRSPLAKIVDALAATPPPDAEIGQVWRLEPPQGEDGISALVVLTQVTPDLRGALLSSRVWMAGHDDMIVTLDDSPWDEEFLICTWRPVRVAEQSLRECLGELPVSVTHAYGALREHQQRGGFELRTRETALTEEGRPKLRWTITRRGGRDGNSYWAGPRILEGDPREDVRTALRDATRWIGQVAPQPEDEPDAAPVVGQLRDWLMRSLQPFTPEAAIHADGRARGKLGAWLAARGAVIGAVGAHLGGAVGAHLAGGVGLVLVPPQLRAAAIAAGLAVGVARRLARKRGEALLHTEFPVGDVLTGIQWRYADDHLLLEVLARDASGSPVEGVEISLVPPADAPRTEQSVITTSDKGVALLFLPLDSLPPPPARQFKIGIAHRGERFEQLIEP